MIVGFIVCHQRLKQMLKLYLKTMCICYNKLQYALQGLLTSTFYKLSAREFILKSL